MANVKDCPGFETFGEDVRAGREAQGLVRKTLAEMVNISSQYLANIELEITIPSISGTLQLIQICRLPAERYFNPSLICGDKLICPPWSATCWSCHLTPSLTGAERQKDRPCSETQLQTVLHL